MRKLLTVIAITVIAGAGTAASPASADTEINGHNCAGAVVSALASPSLGALISATAQAGLVDNLDLRNCGDAEGNNQ